MRTYVTLLLHLFTGYIVLSSSYPSLLDRCTPCSVMEGEEEVCGSDWHTYPSLCQLQWTACRRNWNISLVSLGSCESQCKGVNLGLLLSYYA